MNYTVRTYTDNRKTMGELGEQLVALILGCTISEDQYDMRKDMIDSHGRTVEVKTQNRFDRSRWRLPSLFTICIDHYNQLPKCLKVDRLIFVEYDSSDYVRVWECTDRLDFETYTTKSGKHMAGWSIQKMVLLHEVLNTELASTFRAVSNAAEFRCVQ